ncbi:MAG: histidine phosphatase family protein [Clostridiales bacterium]|nr:histidine phosphatase family protein [Clostridiales bacterium]
MKLYVIRHGRTNCNKEHKYNGRYDEDINEEGIEQAKLASNEIKELDIDLIICSPLKRTRHTMEIINVNNVPVIYDDGLMERDCGKLTLTEIDDFYYKEYYNYYSTEYVEGLETMPQLLKRVHSFLDRIKEEYKDKNILLVTHGAVARAMYFYFEKMPSDGKLLNIGGMKNCEIREHEL